MLAQLVYIRALPHQHAVGIFIKQFQTKLESIPGRHPLLPVKPKEILIEKTSRQFSNPPTSKIVPDKMGGGPDLRLNPPCTPHLEPLLEHLEAHTNYWSAWASRASQHREPQGRLQGKHK